MQNAAYIEAWTITDMNDALAFIKTIAAVAKIKINAGIILTQLASPLKR
jgi:hypothetical protein